MPLPVNDVAYAIVPKGGSYYSVSLGNGDTGVVLAPMFGPYPWSVIRVDQAGGPIFAIAWGYNPTGQLLTFRSPDSPVVLADPVAGNMAQWWNLISYPDYVEFFAVQNCANTSQNLNAAGDGPYPAGTQVLAWDWSGGAPNELWTFVGVNDSFVSGT